VVDGGGQVDLGGVRDVVRRPEKRELLSLVVTPVARADTAEVVEDEEERLLSGQSDALTLLGRRRVSTQAEQPVRKSVRRGANNSIPPRSWWSYACSKAIDGDQESPEAATLRFTPHADRRLCALGAQLPQCNLSLELGDSLRLQLERVVVDGRIG